jgi:hypothetical protein
MIRQDWHVIRDGVYRHGRMRREQFRQQAGVLGIEVLHEHKCHPAIGWHVCEEAGERRQAARRRPDTDDKSALRERTIVVWLDRRLARR